MDGDNSGLFELTRDNPVRCRGGTVQESFEIIFWVQEAGAIDECGNAVSLGFPALVLPPVSAKMFFFPCALQ